MHNEPQICPVQTCRALPGEPCVNLDGNPRELAHEGRHIAEPIAPLSPLEEELQELGWQPKEMLDAKGYPFRRWHPPSDKSRRRPDLGPPLLDE